MTTQSFPRRTFLWVTVFAIAMGFLETAVVIYMRLLLYPKGFAFPLAPIPSSLILVEILREAATIIMLLGIGVLAGKNAISRFAWFIYSFAIWDIFYYVFLKLLIHWPESLMTWDILFLIPTTWVGPVITPIITSLTMILLAILILITDWKKKNAKLNIREWSLLIIGSLVLIISFTWDYSIFMLEHYNFKDIWTVPSEEMLKISMLYIPRMFNWFLFWLSEIIILSGIWLYWKRNR